MPIITPEVFEIGVFGVAVGQAHVDAAAGQGLAGGVRDGTASRPSAMPQNRATAHAVVSVCIRRLACVKITGRGIGFERKCYGVILIKKERSLRWLLN